MLSLREQKQRLDENVKYLRQKKLDKLNFDEHQALEGVKRRFSDKRKVIESMPIYGSLGIQQKIAELEQEIYLLHAKRIQDTTFKDQGGQKK